MMTPAVRRIRGNGKPSIVWRIKRRVLDWWESELWFNQI